MHIKICSIEANRIIYKHNLNYTNEKNYITICVLSFTAFSCTKRYIVVIHGGAGTLQKKDMPPELEQQYKEKLKEALYKAYEKLQQGQTAIGL